MLRLVGKVVEFDKVVVHFNAMVYTVFPTFHSVISIAQRTNQRIPETPGSAEDFSEEMSCD